MNFVTVKPCCILTEIIGLFAEGFPPFLGESGHWDCGITFDIFTHDLHGSCKIYYNIYTLKERNTR